MRWPSGINPQWITYTLGLFVLVVLLGHVLGVSQIRLVQHLDALIYDTKTRLSEPHTPDDRIVIIDIDDRSLAELGQWPLPRDRWAELVDTLFDRYGVALLGFDVLFAEPDKGDATAALDALQKGARATAPSLVSEIDRLREKLDRDGRFAAAIKGRPVVLGYFFSYEAQGGASGQLPVPALARDALTSAARIHLGERPSYAANLPRLQAAAASAGHFNIDLDFDGVARRVPLLALHDGQVYEALSLAMLRVLAGSPPLTLEASPGGWLSGNGRIERLAVEANGRALRVPVDGNGAALIPYRGPPGTFRYVSLADVIKHRTPDEALRGRIALIGTSAGGLLDLRVTPVSNAFVGVEIHANLLAGMLDGTLRRIPAWSAAFEAFLLLFVGAVVLWTLPKLSPLRASLNAVGMALLLIVGNFAAWQGGLALPLASTLLLVGAMFALQMAWGYIVEARTKHQFARLFGQYVPPELVLEMSRNPEHYSMEGQNRELSVVFCDVLGFTSIAERLEPKVVAVLLGEFLTAMTEVIGRHRGTVDKYIGDSIMAFWGAPMSDPAHALHAVETAMEMQAEMERLSDSLVARGFPALAMGVGINTGLVTVGDFGSSVRKAYTAIGDTVNLASRLEGLTRHYGVGIIVGEATRDSTPDYAWRELDRVRVKGRDDAVSIYEPLGPAVLLDPDRARELEAWHAVLADYRAQRWEAAEAGVRTLAQRYPNKSLYALYLGRIMQFKESAPQADWSGVAAFDYK